MVPESAIIKRTPVPTDAINKPYREQGHEINPNHICKKSMKIGIKMNETSNNNNNDKNKSLKKINKKIEKNGNDKDEEH